jgi:hypothetical protein
MYLPTTSMVLQNLLIRYPLPSVCTCLSTYALCFKSWIKVQICKLRVHTCTEPYGTCWYFLCQFTYRYIESASFCPTLLTPQSTYIECTTVYVHSSELGPPHPLSRKRGAFPPEPKGGRHTRLRVSLALSLLIPLACLSRLFNHSIIILNDKNLPFICSRAPAVQP